MYITLLGFIVLLVGIVLFAFCKLCERRRYKAQRYKKFVRWVATSYLDLIGICVMIVGIAIILACSVLILENAITKQVDYEQALYEKKTIEYRIEHQDDNLVGNELLYNDITTFNNELRSTKYWANNPWTSWFNNDKVASLGYIEYELAED